MTLQSYQPNELDDLALRLLDSAAMVRQMAQRCREEGLDEFQINDKKAMEWLGRLEIWVRRASDELEVDILKNRGAIVARQMLAEEEKTKRRNKKKQAKKK